MEIKMDDIKKALNSRYRISDMENLGFDRIYGEAELDFYFKEDLLVKVNNDMRTFVTYPVANKGSF